MPLSLRIASPSGVVGPYNKEQLQNLAKWESTCQGKTSLGTLSMWIWQWEDVSHWLLR